MFVEDNSIYSIFGYNLIVNLEIEKACFTILVKIHLFNFDSYSIQYHVRCLDKFRVTLISFKPNTNI